MKRILFLFILSLSAAVVFAAQPTASFERTKQSTVYLENQLTDDCAWAESPCYQGLDFQTSILWPVAASSAQQLYDLRKCIVSHLVGDSLADVLANRLNLSNFPKILHTRMHTDFYQSIYLSEGDTMHIAAKMPKAGLALDDHLEEMELHRAYSGVYTLFFHYRHMPSGAMGGCHYGFSCLNYDLNLSRPLTIADIFLPERMEEADEALRSESVKHLYEIGELDSATQEDVANFETGFDPKDAIGWYMSDEGVVYLYQCWEVASAAAGVVEVTIRVRDYRHLFRPEALKYWRK